MKQTKEEVMRETERLLVDDAAIIGLYKQVLNGQLKRFPPYTWEMPNSLYYAKVITRYLFENILHWSIDDVKSQFKSTMIDKYKIRGMHQTLFENNFEFIDNAYPNEIFPWELTRIPPNFWEFDENKRAALRWLFEEKLGGDLQEIKKNLSSHTFTENGLLGLFKCFQNSPYKTLEFMYPKKIKPWELGTVPRSFWCDANKREALTWLFEDVFEGNLTKIKQNLCADTFRQNGLRGLLKHFDGSPYQALNFYYPNEVKPWEMSRVPNHFWINEQNRKKALIWLFEEKMNGNLTSINYKIFQQNNLSSLLESYFKSSPRQAMKWVYPKRAIS